MAESITTSIFTLMILRRHLAVNPAPKLAVVPSQHILVLQDDASVMCRIGFLQRASSVSGNIEYLVFCSIVNNLNPDFPYQTGCIGKLLWYNSFKSLLASFIRWGWLECEGVEVDNQY